MDREMVKCYVRDGRGMSENKREIDGEGEIKWVLNIGNKSLFLPYFNLQSALKCSFYHLL